MFSFWLKDRNLFDLFYFFIFFQSLCWIHSKVTCVAGGVVGVRNKVLADEQLKASGEAARRMGRRMALLFAISAKTIPRAYNIYFKVWPPINCMSVSGYSKTVHIYGIFSVLFWSKRSALKCVGLYLNSDIALKKQTLTPPQDTSKLFFIQTIALRQEKNRVLTVTLLQWTRRLEGSLNNYSDAACT